MSAEQTLPFDYKRYLASREWAVLKEQVRKRSRGWCERCSAGDYEETHHLTYERIGREKLEDLLGVCHLCHEFLSAKSDFDPGGEVVLLVMAVSSKHEGRDKVILNLCRSGANMVGLAKSVALAIDVPVKPVWFREGIDSVIEGIKR